VEGHGARAFDHPTVSLPRPIDPSVGTPDPTSNSVDPHKHATKAQYPTHANGGYRVKYINVLEHLPAAGMFKDVEDPQKLCKELDDESGIEQVLECKFDHDTYF
jgi:hypothetical protein